MSIDTNEKMKSDIAKVVNYFEDTDLSDEELLNLSKDIKRIAVSFAKEKCKEQRDLCADRSSIGNMEFVENAPEPLFG